MTGLDLKIFKAIPTLKTERCHLRRLTVRDAEDVFSYAKNPNLTKYLLWHPHPDLDYTKYYLRYVDGKYKKCEFYDWGIEYEGKIVGTAGFTSFDIENNQGEVGYVLNEKLWGRGIAPECVREVIRFGFETLGLFRIYSRCMSGHYASRRVMEKCGMTYEGTLRSAVLAKGIYRDVEISSILKEEFLRASF